MEENLMTNNYLIDHGDWIALRADETENPDSEDVGIYPSDYLSKENFAGYHHLGSFLMNTETHRGEEKLSVIRRESDQALFGFEFWFSGGKHGEDYAECNSEDAGDFSFPTDPENDYPVWCVFKPVEPHCLPTYRFKKDAKTP